MNRKDLRSPLQGGLQVFFCIRIKRTGSSLPFQKIFHTAARRSAQAKKGLCRRPADIVLPLLKKPDLTDGHAGFFGESGLREQGTLSACGVWSGERFFSSFDPFRDRRDTWQ